MFSLAEDLPTVLPAQPADGLVAACGRRPSSVVTRTTTRTSWYWWSSLSSIRVLFLSDGYTGGRANRPYFEHKLFLTATPHNGHTRSFSGLLELLDPVRLTRTSEFRPEEKELFRNGPPVVNSAIDRGPIEATDHAVRPRPLPQFRDWVCERGKPSANA